MDAGDAFNLVKFGLYATESMRLEKAYRHWKADLICENTPFEACLDRFVNMEKSKFIGKEALLMQCSPPLNSCDKSRIPFSEKRPLKTFISLSVDCEIAAAHSGDGVYLDGQLIGSVTSAGYGHRVQKNLALAFINQNKLQDCLKPTAQVTVEIIGQHYAAQLNTITLEKTMHSQENSQGETTVELCLIDPTNTKVRQ